MKFTDQQQKWALTTSLLVILGFSFSMHFSPKSGPEYAQLGAAQEQIEPVMMAKNLTEEEVMHLSSNEPSESVVKTVVIKSPEVNVRGKTEASATPIDAALKVKGQYEDKKAPTEEPKKDESSITCQDLEKISNCPTCLEVKLMNIDKTSGLSDLIQKFAAAGLTKCRSQEDSKNSVVAIKTSGNAETVIVPSVAPSTTSSAPAEEKEKSEEDKHQAVFDKAKATCDKKSKDDRLDCNIREFTKLLTNDKITYSKSVVLDFFKKNIETSLVDELESYDTNDPVAFQEKVRSVGDKIKELQNEIGKDYSYIREKLGNISIRAIAKKALEINQYHQSPYVTPENLMAERAATNQLQFMAQYLPSANRAGLAAAVSSSLISNRYASNIYGSIDNYRNGIMSNIANISNMSPLEADLLLNTGLSGLDSWRYERSAFNGLTLNSGIRGRYDSAFRRGFYDDSLSDGLSIRSGQLLGRGNGLYDRGYSLGSGLRTSRTGRGVSRLNLNGSSVFNTSNIFNNNRFGSQQLLFPNNNLVMSTSGQLGPVQTFRSGFNSFDNRFDGRFNSLNQSLPMRTGTRNLRNLSY